MSLAEQRELGSRNEPETPTEPRSLTPPQSLDAVGEPRCVGVEIEFLGLSLERAAVLVIELFGGQTLRKHEYDLRVVDASLGEFRIEVDSSPLKAIAKKRKRWSRSLVLMDHVKERFFGAVAQHVTPNEISTAPIAPERLVEIDQLVHALGRAGAEGTDASPFYMFGVHLNPTVPSTDPLVLRDHIRAYVLLHEWLVEALHMDLSRRMMGYATAYPVSYARLVLDPSYAPHLGQLIDDYLEHNPTRNRGLDLLPLFAHLDRERVVRTIHDDRVSARSTFHFRLPNSQVHDPNWLVSDEWKVWLEVERLANDPRRLAELSRGARRQLRAPFAGLSRKLVYARPQRARANQREPHEVSRVGSAR